MSKIDITLLDALSEAIVSSVQKFDASAKTDKKYICCVKINFIKQFTQDMFFLNDHSEDDAFSRRYGNLIIRDMLEQLIEFLYLLKNPRRAEECLGLTINLENLNKGESLIQKTKLFGDRRYNKESVKHRRYGKKQNIRPSVSEMAENIGEKHSTDGSITLYDLYQILSDRCHNAYFSSFLDDINKVNHSIPASGLDESQLRDIQMMATVVLREFSHS